MCREYRGVGERKAKISTLDSQMSVLRYGFSDAVVRDGFFRPRPRHGIRADEQPESLAGRGLRGDRAARIAPRIARIARNGALDKEQRVMDGFASLQDRNVLITQRSKEKAAPNTRVEIYVSSTFDSMEEEDGWIFVREGNSFGAIRIVAPNSNAYRWLEPADKNRNSDANKNVVVLQDPDSPIIIIASEASDYARTTSRYSRRPCAPRRSTTIADTEVRRPDVLRIAEDREPVRRDDRSISAPPVRFPFLRSQWETGKIFLRFGNEAASFDFSDPDKPRKGNPGR